MMSSILNGNIQGNGWYSLVCQWPGCDVVFTDIDIYRGRSFNFFFFFHTGAPNVSNKR